MNPGLLRVHSRENVWFVYLPYLQLVLDHAGQSIA